MYDARNAMEYLQLQTTIDIGIIIANGINAIQAFERVNASVQIETVNEKVVVMQVSCFLV